MSLNEVKPLCDTIRETSFAIHKYLRGGFQEKIYENALAHRLRKQRLLVEQQHPIAVYDDDGELLGDFRADLLVENKVIVEIKSCKTLIDEHIAQLLGYLRATRIEDGLLVNFGTQRLQIRKFIVSDIKTL